MEWWSTGMMEWWSDGVMEWWSDGVLEYWSDGRRPGLACLVLHHSTTPSLHPSLPFLQLDIDW